MICPWIPMTIIMLRSIPMLKEKEFFKPILRNCPPMDINSKQTPLYIIFLQTNSKKYILYYL